MRGRYNPWVVLACVLLWVVGQGMVCLGTIMAHRAQQAKQQEGSLKLADDEGVRKGGGE